MENKFLVLREALLKMEVTSVLTAQALTGLSRQEIIDFVSADKTLRIFDNEAGVWLNENAVGHC